MLLFKLLEPINDEESSLVPGAKGGLIGAGLQGGAVVEFDARPLFVA